MRFFKKAAAGLLLASYLTSADAHKGQACQHGKHQGEALPHYFRSTLEDLDLAAGNSPFTGKPQTTTRSISVTIGPDGKRTIVGGDEEDFKRFFEVGPDGMPHARGSNFGRNDPFGSHFGSSFGRNDPFGSSPFGTRDPFSRPSANPSGSRPRQTEDPEQKRKELEEILKKLREAQGEQPRPRQEQPAKPVKPEEPVKPVKPEEPKPQKPAVVEAPAKVTEPQQEEVSDADEKNGSGSWRNPQEEAAKKAAEEAAKNQAGKPQEPLAPVKLEGSPFRIVADYTTVRVNSQKHSDYITKSLMPAVIDYFTAALRLKYPLKDKIYVPEPYTRSANICDGGIDRSYITKGVEGDLIILTRVSNAPQEGYVARAASCVFDSRTGRTIVSSINFNLAHIELDDGSNPLSHAKNVMTALHELTHVLGFSGALYKNYLLPNGQPNRNVLIQDEGVNIVNVEPLTSKLRKHFGCNKIKGAPLENEGGSGSAGAHFERRIFGNEFMTASEVFDGKVSEFTLALLEGTGWYNVDYNMAEPYHVGQGEGCEFFFGQCMNTQGKPNFPEFCEKDGRRQCSGSRNGVAICSFGDQFSDGCGMPQVQYEYDCRNPEAAQIAELLPELQVFGPTSDSKCFMGTLTPKRYRASQASTFCLNYKCNGTGSTATLDIIIGKTVAKCDKAGDISVNGFEGQINCPDPVAFCSSVQESFCPRGCTGRGTCVNGKCQCKAGFKGFDCAYTA